MRNDNASLSDFPGLVAPRPAKHSKLKRRVASLQERVEFLEERLARYEEALGEWLDEEQRRRERVTRGRRMPRLRPA